MPHRGGTVDRLLQVELLVAAPSGAPRRLCGASNAFLRRIARRGAHRRIGAAGAEVGPALV